MWYLTNSKGDLIYLKPNKELTFGRKRSDILLQNDESISRVHAAIRIETKDIVKINEPISTCSLNDMGSKYGTYVFSGNNQIEVTKDKYILKDKDQIRFGLQHHTFTINYLPIILVVSTLNEDEKNRLHNLMEEIDGMISTDWTSTCTHLTVSKATLTEKVTWAMACAVPIVTVKYWEHVKEAFENARKLPDPNDFVPLISEGLINRSKVSLSPNEGRKNLFKNLIFVHFSSRQYKTYGRMINMAGGTSVLYTKKRLSNKELCAPNVVVLQYSSSEASQSTQCIVPEYDAIDKVLQANKRRMVPESEIPLAILHCSVAMHCNPKFKFAKFLKRSQPSHGSSDVIVLDTQDVRPLPKVISDVPLKLGKQIKRIADIIPETCDTLCTDSICRDSSNGSQKKAISSTETRRYIPETNDTVSNSETSVEENVADKSAGGPISLKKGADYIPETNDSFNNDDIRGERNIESLLNIALSLDTNTARQIGDSVTICKVKMGTAEKSSSKRNVDYIPETNDSFDKDEANVERGTESLSRKQLTPKQSSNTKAVKQFDDSSVVKKSTVLHDIIDTNVEDKPTPPKKQSIFNFDKSQEYPIRKEGKKVSKVSNIIHVNIDEDILLEKENNANKPSKDPEKQSTKITQATKRLNKNATMADKSISISNDELIVCDRKRVCLENSKEDSLLSSPDSVSPQKIESSRNFTNSIKNNSSFLRANPLGKRFEKVYKSVPKKRITVDNMYVWSVCNTRMG